MTVHDKNLPWSFHVCCMRFYNFTLSIMLLHKFSCLIVNIFFYILLQQNVPEIIFCDFIWILQHFTGCILKIKESYNIVHFIKFGAITIFSIKELFSFYELLPIKKNKFYYCFNLKCVFFLYILFYSLFCRIAKFAINCLQMCIDCRDIWSVIQSLLYSEGSDVKSVAKHSSSNIIWKSIWGEY